MKYTGNYNLAKPDPTDLVDISVLNGNMDAIDAELKKHEIEQESSKRSVEVTLYESRWTTRPPYAQTVVITGIKKSDTIQIISAITKDTPTQDMDVWEKMAGMLKYGTVENGRATFYCPKKRPTSDFKIKLVGVSST